MEGPPSASGSMCQLVLEHLRGALLVISGSWRHSPRLPVWPWAMLLWTVLLLCLVRRRLPQRRAKAPGQRGSGRPDVCGAGREEIGPTTRADEARRPPGVLASLPLLQTLCLRDMNAKLSGLVLRDTVNVLQKAQKSQPPKLPQVTGEKPILTTPGKDGEHAGAGTWGVQPKSGVGNGHEPARRAAVDLEGVTDDAGVRVPRPSPEGDQQDRARQLGAERQEIAELTRQVHRLQAQKTSLQRGNSQLDREIRQLRLQLEKSLEEQDERILQLHRSVFREEAQTLEIKKKLAGLYRDMNFTCQLRNLYKKMAQDLSQELERTRSHYRKEVLFHQDRAARSWEAAASGERKFQELRRENERMRQMLAGLQSNRLPFPREPLAPAARPAAPRGGEGSGGPWGHQAPREEGDPLGGPGMRGPRQVGLGSGRPGSAATPRLGPWGGRL